MVACKRSQPTPTRQLLDNPLLLWLAVTPARLPPALRSDRCDRRRPFLYSVVSLWEVAIKTPQGTPGVQVDAGQLWSGLRQQGLEDVPSRRSTAWRCSTCPGSIASPDG